MARFSSFINMERGNEIHRLGNREISSKTFATETSVKVSALAFPDAENKKVTHETVWVEIMNGYQQYFHGVVPIFTIEDGIIKIPDNFMQKVEKYNEEIIARRKAIENLK